MNKDRIIELMARKLSGEATPDELQELREQISKDTAAGERDRVLEQFWSRHDDGMHPSVEENLKRVLTSLDLNDTTTPPVLRLSRKRWWLWAAAAIPVLLTVGIVFARHRDSRDPLASLMEKHNAKGTKSIIQLPDGSKIWLNADSKIRYPESFKGASREIYLNGEAFFDVVKSPDHPFVIHLANGTVKVLGTSFNVRAYDNEPVVETSVATGRIAFIPRYRSANKRQDTIVVAADHKASYAFTKEELRTSATSSVEDKAWTEGKLIFRGMTMEQIAIELERNFGKKVVFVDSTPMAYVFTGSFENNTLDEIMYYLSRTKNFSYKITNTELLISAGAGQLTN
ncbi:MAG: FecR domain-containing protein [Bacteroidetes bacterium]|nr:FecR domain-containing protein [Bacteroidota bacterium]